MCMAVAIVFAASCNKIEEGITSVEGNGRTVITAVAEAVGGGTKAHNQYSYDVLWDKGDKIYVVGKENTNTFTDSVSGTQCVMKSTTFPDIARNTVGRITLSGSFKGKVPAGALPGKFTVDADGKQVYFSKGNLQAFRK